MTTFYLLSYIAPPPRFLLALQIVFMIGCLGVHGQTQNEACREPVNVMEIYQGLRRQEIERSGEEQPTRVAIREATENNGVIITALNRTCHHRRRASSCECRTRHELNFDPNRIPRVHVQSRCCRRNHHFTENWMTECKEVYHNVRAMRRTGCFEGVYQYNSQFERLPVGCTCNVVQRVHSAS